MNAWMALLWSVSLPLSVLALDAAPDGKKGADADKKPLVLFLGDSLTVGSQSHPDKARFPFWSYAEAIQMLAGTNSPYRFEKRAMGGNSICGQYPGLKAFFKKVCGGGRESAPEGLRYIIFQDSAVDHRPLPDEYEQALRECLGFVEKVPGVRVILCTTAFEGRKEGDALQEAWNKVNVVMRNVAEEKKLGMIELDVFWPRYITWYKGKKLPLSEEKKWRITGIDTVHPQHVGAIFLAMIIARELGIPPEALDIENPDLMADKAMLSEIRAFVYSWKEPVGRANAVRHPG
jgi:hypothetical protein